MPRSKHSKCSTKYTRLPGSPQKIENNGTINHNRRSNTDFLSDTSTASGDDEQYDAESCERVRLHTPLQASSARTRYKLNIDIGGHRRRCYWHCNVRKLSRLLVCLLLVPMFFVMLYMPLYSNVQSRQVALADWGYNTSRNIADYVQPDNDTTLMEPRGICENKTFLLIVVTTGVHNFAQRQTIRETWGNVTEFTYETFTRMHAHLKDHYLKPSRTRLNYYREYLQAKSNSTRAYGTVAPVVRVVFLIGRSKYEALMGNETLARVRNEQDQYNDIVQHNFIDTYNNLTLKAVFALKWLSRRCLSNTAYFMKCDDDTFVNIPNLLHYLLGGTVPLYNDTLELYDAHTYQTLHPTNRLNRTHDYLAGHLFCTSRPVANVSSKWYIPSYMYPDDRYPPYLSGAGYIMSTDVVQRLYEVALNTSLIHLEDVYVTGMCASKINVPRHHNPLFSYSRSKELCTFKGSITQHEMKDDSLMEAYAFVTNTSIKCPPPGKYFKRIRLRKIMNCK